MSWRELASGLREEISRDGVTDLAASVTYYGILSLFPFLLFVVAVASVVITPSDAERLVGELSRLAPGPATEIVGERIRELGERQNVSLLGVGALGAIWAASGGIMGLMRALNRCYDVSEGRPWWKVRGVAVLMTLVAGALALAAALVAIAAAPLAGWMGGPAGTVIVWLRLPVAGLVMMFLWGLLYYVLPDVEQRFKFITAGSVAGVVLWVLASWAFSRYVTSFASYDKTYGSLGGVIVLLLWMWISSFLVLVGAEVNAFIEHRSPEGKRQGAKRNSDAGTEPVASASPVGEPVRAARPARAGSGTIAASPPPAASALPPSRRKAPVRGLVAVAAGLAAGLLIARREA